MKLVKSNDSVFVPFDITIKLETPEEARLMWHVMNKAHLWDAIRASRYVNYTAYVAQTFSGDDDKVKREIENHVSIS